MPNRTFSIVMPEDLIQQLDMIALVEQHGSRSAVIREGAERIVKEKGAKTKEKIKAMLEER